jgi:hypothetical protein
MVDFSRLLSAPAGEAVKPPPLPMGEYLALITSHELTESKNKNPCIRINFCFLSWPSDVTPVEGVNLANKKMRKDFYYNVENGQLDLNSLWRFDAFLVTLGIELAGRSYIDVLPEVVGKQILVELIQDTIKEGKDAGNIVNQVNSIVGVA